MADWDSNDYYANKRFQIPRGVGEVKSPYDQGSPEGQDEVARNPRPVVVRTFDLSTAGQALIDVQGGSFVFYGHDGTDNKAVDSTSLVNVFINSRTNNGAEPYPAKHARGYHNPFMYLYIEWPAQSGVFVDLVIYMGGVRPWIDGESCT